MNKLCTTISLWTKFARKKWNIYTIYKWSINCYNMFTAPTNGIYVFNWNLYSSYHGDVVSELMVNSNSKGCRRSDSSTVNEDHSSSGCVVVALNHGDIVFIRTHLTSQQNGQIISKPGTYESSFSGWLLYWKLIEIKFCYVLICLTHRIKNIYEIKTNS